MALPVSTPDNLSPAQQFVLWAEATLRSARTHAAKGNRRFDSPNGLRAAHAATFVAAGADSHEELFRRVVCELQSAADFQHAAPRQQPHSPDDVAPAIVAAYEFAGGQVQLASAALEDQPILRLTFVPTDSAHGAAPAVRHAFYWLDGEELDETLVAEMSLDDLATWAADVPTHEPQRVRRWIDACLLRDRQRRTEGNCGELAVATLVWCKHLAGKITLTAGGSSTTIPIAGWGQRLATGGQQPPAYRCPLTKIETHCLGVTSDGRIVPREALATCDESKCLVLAGELGTCAATGKRVRVDLLDTCLATGQRVLRSLLAPCSQCAQPVAPGALSGGRCSACRALAPVRSDDPRMARVLGEYPKLDRWSRWQLAETHSTYVLVTRSWVRQVLLVVHKETLSVLYAAVAGRIYSPWQEMSQVQRDELLG